MVLGLLAAFPSLTMAQSRELIVNIQFDSQVSSNILVTPAILKYNKEFAFSFTFDDARSDAYNLGFKLMNGGFSITDSATYPGLFYTDGCGNLVPFRAGISWVTANTDSFDLHNYTPSYLTYSHARTLYDGGWDFFNHSYNHSANSPSIDYHWQLSANSEEIKAHAGIKFNICVPPSGDSGYIEPAFDLGMLACISENDDFIGFNQGVDVTVPVPVTKPKYYRRGIDSDNFTALSLESDIDQWVATTGNGRQKWWNEFTHRIDYNHISSSVEFPVFRAYLEYLEQKYGKPGNDHGWFAGSAEVFEYLLVRDKVAIHLEKNGSILSIHLDYSKVPETLRYNDLSLIMKNAGNIQSVYSTSLLRFSQAQTSEGILLNIKVPDSYFTKVENVVMSTQAVIRCYPNPTSGTLYLTVPAGIADPRIVISGMSSSMMPQPAISISNGLICLDLRKSNYPQGVYAISVFSGKKLIGSSKVILNF